MSPLCHRGLGVTDAAQPSSVVQILIRCVVSVKHQAAAASTAAAATTKRSKFLLAICTSRLQYIDGRRADARHFITFVMVPAFVVCCRRTRAHL